MRSRILVVEDNLDTARLIDKALSLDYDVVVCHEAEEAARHLLSGETFHVIICDINLPGRDGISLFEDMKVMGDDLEKRFIFSSSADRSTIEKTGAAFLQKPFRFADLKELVAKKIEEDAKVGAQKAGVPKDVLETPANVPASVDVDDLDIEGLDNIHFDGLDV